MMDEPTTFVHKHYGIYLKSENQYFFLAEDEGLYQCLDWINRNYNVVVHNTPDKVVIFDPKNNPIRTINIQ